MIRTGISVLIAATAVVLLVFGCTSNKGTTPDEPPPQDNSVSGIFRTKWNMASRPVVIDDSLSERGCLAWYNPLEGCPITEIWDRDVGIGEPNTTHILVLEYRPVDFIRYADSNNNIIDSSTYQIPPEWSWNGIMRPLPTTTATAFQQAHYFDIRLRGDVGIMHIDLGQISEDVIENGITNTEDPYLYHTLDPLYDNGLDMLPDWLEFGYNPDQGIMDPTGDNWSPDDIWRINGTEGNRIDPDGGYYPDTEDRNYNGLETINSYFSYRVDLSDNRSYYVPQSENEYGWKTIRLPVGDEGVSDTGFGAPSWNNIKFMRIWFDSIPASFMNNSLKVEMASMTLDVPYDTVTPPPHEETVILRDVDDRRRTFYDLGRLDTLLIDRCRSDTFPEPEKYDFFPGDSIIKIIVYHDDWTTDPARLERTPGLCYIDPVDTLADDPQCEYRTLGYFDIVDENDYYVNPTRYYIQFLRPIITADDIFCVYMEVLRNGVGIIDTLGNISGDTLRLKLIKPKAYIRPDRHIWAYEWKNVYYLGKKSIYPTDLEIYKGVPIDPQNPNPDDLNHQEGIPYLQILGLDQGDDQCFGLPDGAVDRLCYINPNLGLLFFPTRYPFDSRLSFIDDEHGDPVYLHDSVPEMYLRPSQMVYGSSKYYMTIKYMEYPWRKSGGQQ